MHVLEGEAGVFEGNTSVLEGEAARGLGTGVGFRAGVLVFHDPLPCNLTWFLTKVLFNRFRNGLLAAMSFLLL